jgi:hypothetical protein
MDIAYWHPLCPDSENQWLHYAVKTWAAKMQLYVDFSPGFGRTFVPMAKATNRLALAFICSDDPSLNMLLHNLATNSLAEKVSISLLQPFRSEWTADYYKESLVSRLTHYSIACPDVAHAQYMHTAQLSDVSLLLHNRELLVDSCAATIYFDTNVTSLLEAVSDYLHAADYALEYVDLCSDCALDGGSKNVRRFLFAAPKAARDAAAEPRSPPLRLSTDAERLSFERFFAKAMKYNQPPQCDATEAAASPSDAFALSVPWSVLTPPTSPVSMCFPEVLHGHLREEQEELRVERAQDLREHSEVTMYLQWRCAAWTRRLRKRYERQVRLRLVTDPSALVSCFAGSTPTATAKVAWSTVPRDQLHERLMGVVDAELAAATAECLGFAQQQYFFLLQLHATRRAFSNAATPPYAQEALPVAYAHHSTADAETVQRRWFAVDDAAGRPSGERAASEDFDEDGASFSNGLDAQRRRQAATRPPLGVLWEPDRCADPVYCQLLYGFQRRLFLWQNPDQRHLLSKLFRVDEYNHVEISALQQLWEGRTCASAKYLIYEPWTDYQGLGSMWEQIAAAMRYAVCHGRIFVLYSAEDQAGTARKWRYPGCRGSLWECYFEPVTSCALTAQAYAQAIRLPDDVPLDSEDYAQEQFVRFEGIQIVGKCRYCDGDWPPDEEASDGDGDGGDSFFEGVGLKRFSLFAKETLVEVYNPNYAVFASSFRHLTTMPFVRYLVRPRGWLQTLLPQLVAATMVSPVAGPQSQVPPPLPSPRHCLVSCLHRSPPSLCAAVGRLSGAFRVAARAPRDETVGGEPVPAGAVHGGARAQVPDDPRRLLVYRDPGAAVPGHEVSHCPCAAVQLQPTADRRRAVCLCPQGVPAVPLPPPALLPQRVPLPVLLAAQARLAVVGAAADLPGGRPRRRRVRAVPGALPAERRRGRRGGRAAPAAREAHLHEPRRHAALLQPEGLPLVPLRAAHEPGEPVRVGGGRRLGGHPVVQLGHRHDEARAQPRRRRRRVPQRRPRHALHDLLLNCAAAEA